MRLVNVLENIVIGMKAIVYVITGTPVVVTSGGAFPTIGKKVLVTTLYDEIKSNKSK
ncbi:MAG: hypothetical protein LIR50_19325 [Bacillota bacterium]|nr:hypothetical protein [Bacillota bacterium]